MAKRRKVGNLLGLAVLSVVVERPMHPYEMASVLTARDKDQDMEIKWGTLYRVVQNLEKHGFLEPSPTERHGGRPERTVYRITETGREELTDWARELVSTPETEHPRFRAGLSVMSILRPDDVTRLLEARVRQIAEQIESKQGALDNHSNDVPRLFLIEDEYDLAMRRAELDWTRSLLRELTEGTFPGLEQWWSFHRTGQTPAELAEIAARGEAAMPTDEGDPS